MATKKRTKKISIIGLGYVGLANYVLPAPLFTEVVGYDTDEEKVRALNQGTYPVDELKLKRVLSKPIKNHKITSNPEDLKGSFAYFISVGTPEKEDGSCDLSYFEAAVGLIKSSATLPDTYIVIRSTVEIGTADRLKESLKDEPIHYHVISIPEFLREGSSYDDELNPDRIVIGSDKEEEAKAILNLRKDVVSKGIPVYWMSNVSAETTKYASNFFLALKIAYANEMARVSGAYGADIKDVLNSVGADHRIGRSMLGAGIGFGGSCLPKDLKALSHSAKNKDVDVPLLDGALDSNVRQRKYLLDKMHQYLGDLKGKTIAVAGLSFKEGVADVRSSLALPFMEELHREGAIVNGFDLSEEALKQLKDSPYHLYHELKDAVKDADALVFLTGEKRFKTINEANLLKAMPGRFIFDGRNIFSLQYFKYFHYISMGRPDQIK